MESDNQADRVTELRVRHAGGRPRIKIDQDTWGWLDFEGATTEASAAKLGVSKRTLQRRKRQRRLEDAPMR